MQGDNAWKILAVYDFNRNFATEFSYFDLGSYDFGSALVPARNLYGRAGISGFGMDVVATVPMTENFSGFLHAGLTRTSVEQTPGQKRDLVSNTRSPKRLRCVQSWNITKYQEIR